MYKYVYINCAVTLNFSLPNTNWTAITFSTCLVLVGG